MLLALALALASPTGPLDLGLMPKGADDRPVAYMIAAESRFTKERRDLLESIGFRPERIDPVYLETDCSGGNDSKQRAMWGIASAHQNAMKKIVETGRRALILESDWGIGNQKVSDVREAMAEALNREEHYVAVGWCRQMRHEGKQPWRRLRVEKGRCDNQWLATLPWAVEGGVRPSVVLFLSRHFTCATAYFMSVEAATNFTKLKHDDGEHAPCFPVDSLIIGACKDRSARWKEWNIRLDGRCCWWPGDATNSSMLNFPGYPASQRGMFQQDRDSFISTHNDGGTEEDEDHAAAAGALSLSLHAGLEPAPSAAAYSPWFKLNPPALCGAPTWGVPGARDPAAAAGAINGLEPPRRS